MKSSDRKNIAHNYKPKEFHLSRNYPDPFKEKTTIQYSVPHKEKINITVMDYELTKIKTLVNEVKDKGIYNVEFFANGLKEGIYIYTIIAGRFVMTRRMLYLK